MPETITTFNTVEKKAGSNDRGAYVLTTFTDVEGKKFKTFDDDTASKGEKLLGQAVAVSFGIKSRQWDGRTLVDNMIESLGTPGEVTTGESGGRQGRQYSPNAPIQNKIFAFKAATDLLGTAPEMFGEETPNFVGICRVADAIYLWASDEEKKASDPDPDPEPEPVTN